MRFLASKNAQNPENRMIRVKRSKIPNKQLSLSESFEIIGGVVEQLNRGRAKVADAEG